MFFSNVTIRIRILDENDNKPRFNVTRYYGNVTENNEQSEPRDLLKVLNVSKFFLSELHIFIVIN